MAWLQDLLGIGKKIYNLPQTASQTRAATVTRLALSNKPVNGVMGFGDYAKSIAAPIQGATNTVRSIPAIAYGVKGAVTPGQSFKGNIEAFNRVVPTASFATNATQHAVDQGTLPKFARTITAAGDLAGGMVLPAPGIGKVGALERALPIQRLAGYTGLRAAEGYGYGAANELARSGDFKAANRAGEFGALTAGVGNIALSPRLTKAAGDHFVEAYRIGEHANELTKKINAPIPKNRIIDNLPGGVPVRSGMFTEVKDNTNQEIFDAMVNRGKENGKGARYMKAVPGNTRTVQDSYGTGNILSVQPDNPKFIDQLNRLKTKEDAKVVIRRGSDPKANAVAANIEAKMAKGAPVQGPLPEPKAVPVAKGSKLATETPEAVRANLQSKIDNLETRVYGSATSDFKPTGTKGAGKIGGVTRGLQEKTSGIVAKGLATENPLLRSIARGVRGLFGNSGNSATQTAKLGAMRGGIDDAVQLANDFHAYGQSLVNKDKGSLERLHAVLDPDLAKVKVSEASLKPEEKQALAALREVSDVINDSNYAQGRISKELWEKNRGGKYIARAYEAYDLPPEVSKALSTSRGKLDLGQFTSRKAVDQWKVDEAIRDPFYLMGKRLQQTFANDAVGQYGSFISKNPDMVSAVERPGFTKLADSKAWGELSGKYVRQDVLEGIKGFYSDHKAIQGLYDALNAYDKLAPRQFLKATKTVYNPATRLGNQIGNRTFALLNGIDPFKFEATLQGYAKKALKENDPLVRFMRKNGVLGTDMSKKEIVQRMADLGVEPKGLAKVDEFIKKTYGNADDHAKIAAFKYWIDKGKTAEEALTKVRNGFQDYNTVGLFYDLGAKTPLFGNAFVRFQGDLTRILKNAALENPLGVLGLVGGIAAMGDFASNLSGETPKDRQTREDRTGAPKLPYTDISLAFQTPYGEVNAARLFGLYAQTPAGGDSAVTSQISKQLPFQIPTDKESFLKNAGSDVLVGPAISTLTDTDFRGKSIADPNQNKYQPSTLTTTEKNLNRARFLERSYAPPFANALEDVGQAAAGNKDFYGKERTVPQAVARLGGVKVEQYGPQQAKEERDRQSQRAEALRGVVRKQIDDVQEQLKDGKISEETANARIRSLTEQLTSVGGKQYEISDDAPKNLWETAKVYGKGAIKDPTNTLEALFTDERLRKVNGDTAIFERQLGLDKQDLGNKDTQVDHKVALALGGSNNQNNLEIISAEDNAKKGVLETRLMRQVAAGEITKAEAQKQELNWREAIKSLTGTEKAEASQQVKQQAEPVTQPTKDSRDAFKKSGKVFDVIGGVVYSLSPTGKVQTQTYSAYQGKIDDATYSQKLKEVKSSKDYAGYLSLQEARLKALEEQKGSLDKNRDAAKIITLETKQKSILSEVSKYQEKGGFPQAKAKKAKARKTVVVRGAKSLGHPTAPRAKRGKRARRVKAYAKASSRVTGAYLASIK